MDGNAQIYEALVFYFWVLVFSGVVVLLFFRKELRRMSNEKSNRELK
jgi:hypothetical protein